MSAVLADFALAAFNTGEREREGSERGVREKETKARKRERGVRERSEWVSEREIEKERITRIY